MKKNDLNNVLLPGNVIFFHDKVERKKPDNTGCNQIGIITSNKTILLQRNKKIIELPFESLRGITCQIRKPNEEYIQKGIIEFINLNKMNRYLFQLALHSLSNGDNRLFEKPLLMPIFDNINQSEHHFRWENLEKNIKNGDIIFTFHMNSIISRVIANLDQGSWSHTGIYLGEGEIFEAVTSGVLKRDLTTYKDLNIRVGIYRTWESSEELNEQVLLKLENEIGKKYNYIGAMKLGLQKLIGIKNKVPTPNEIIYSGNLFLVCYV